MNEQLKAKQKSQRASLAEYSGMGAYPIAGGSMMPKLRFKI